MPLLRPLRRQSTKAERRRRRAPARDEQE